MSIRFHFNDTIGDLSFAAKADIPSTGITGIFGASGAGKTSLLRAIAGLDVRRGEVRVNKQLWQNSTHCLKPAKRQVGYVMQQAKLFPHLTVKQNIQYGAKGWNETLAQHCDLLGIGSLLKRSPEKLSGGETQRVAIARALARRPRLLLLDEPLSAVDETRRREILPYLQSLHRSLSIPCLLVSHNLDEIAALADHMLVMENGAVSQAGPIHEVLTSLQTAATQQHRATAIIDGVVTGAEPEFGLFHLRANNSDILLTVAGENLTIGTALRVQIHANDVSITRTAANDSSILNILPAEVVALQGEGNKVLVKLQCDGFSLLSRVTQKSQTLLNLRAGDQVFAQAKTVAVAL